MGYIRDFPQQLPGPAQAASVGVDPQHAVSPGPGTLFVDVPDKDECAEIIFLSLLLPQALQCSWSSEEVMRISVSFPHSRHR